MSRNSLRKAKAFTLASSASLLALSAATSPASAQQSPSTQAAPVQPAETTPSSSTASGGNAQKLPSVVVTQPKAPAAAKVSKPNKPKVVAAPDDESPSTPAKPKVAAKKKTLAKPQPALVEAAAEPAASEPSVALGSYNPALDVPGLALPPGTMLTTAGPVDGYRALTAMSSTKTATPIEQIPQSIQVVPQQVIKDQTNLYVNETLKNVSNVQGADDLGIANTDFASSRIRGIKAEQWLDGLVVNYSTGDRDAFANVERIEVLKGPAAILYGGGTGAPAGGAINIISKLPTNVPGGAFGVTFGSHSFARPYFDINQPLSTDGTVLFRITGEYTSADSFVEVLEQDRYSINPTLTLTNKTDSTLTIQARKSRYTQQAYPGLPAFGTVAGNLRIDPHLYAGDPTVPRSYSEVEGVTATFDHKLNDVWSFNLKSRWSQSEFDQMSQGPVSAVPDGFFGLTNFQLVDVDLQQKQEEFVINPNVQAKFDAGPTKNVLLLGADYSRSTDRGHMNTNFLAYFTGLLPELDVLNPVYSTPYADPATSPFFFPFFDFRNVYKTGGVYAQMQTTVHDRVHLLGGLRWADLNVEYVENTLATTFRVEDNKVLPRAGIVVDLVPGLSAYASYSEGMRWGGFAQTLDIKPEYSEQREAGIKFNIGSQLSGTMAVFDIERSNIPSSPVPFNVVLTDQRARGFETDALWQPDRNWQLLASYGYTDAELTSGGNTGNALVQVPQHSGRLWVNYTFDEALRGWSVGAGVYAASSQFVDDANTFSTKGYFTVDAKIGYETDHFAATFNVKNLTGEDYYLPYNWFGGQVSPGAERAIYGTLAYKY